MLVPFDENWTVPLGCARPLNPPEIVAVSVTLCPLDIVLLEEATAVVVPTFVIVSMTEPDETW